MRPNQVDEVKYLSVLESARAWNATLLEERQERVPCFDQNTNVFQSNCHLYVKISDRIKHKDAHGEPVIRYKRRKFIKKPKEESDDMTAIVKPLVKEQFSVPSTIGLNMSSMNNSMTEFSNMEDYEMDEAFFTVPNDPDDAPDEEEDDDIYEGDYRKRRNRKAAAKRRSRKAAMTANATQPAVPALDASYTGQMGYAAAPGQLPSGNSLVVSTSTDLTCCTMTLDNGEKAYFCPMCPHCHYKSRPGLNYHFCKIHPGLSFEQIVRHREPHKPATTCLGYQVTSYPAPVQPQPVMIAPVINRAVCMTCNHAQLSSNPSEQLISCHDCGKRTHPTCANFTANMVVSLRRYQWQCFDCKTCVRCRVANADDVLIFCDDCDRGFHLYCLVPPLQTPPEGAWSCTDCLVSFDKTAAAVVDREKQKQSEAKEAASSGQAATAAAKPQSTDDGDSNSQTGNDNN